jgi:hypothetical protein
MATRILYKLLVVMVVLVLVQPLLQTVRMVRKTVMAVLVLKGEMVVMVERMVRRVVPEGTAIPAGKLEEPEVLEDMQLQRTLIQLLLQTTVQLQVHKDN